MALLLFVVLVFVSLWLIYSCIRREGVFSAPCIFTLVVLLVLGPQMIQVLNTPIIDNGILVPFFIVVISSEIAFYLGFYKTVTTYIEYQQTKTLNIEKCHIIVIIFTIIHLIALAFYYGLIYGPIDAVVVSLFRTFGKVALILCFIVIGEKGLRKGKRFLFFLILNTYIFYFFAFDIKGSRTITYELLLIYCMLIGLYSIKWRKKIHIFFLTAFVIGTIMSSGIGDLRIDIEKNSSNFSVKRSIDKYINQMNGQSVHSPMGNDVYNAAQYIDYCSRNIQYNYGLTIWNGLVFNFVPKRLVGEEVKESLMSDLENRKQITKLTHNITTVTGFGEAFSCFSYFAFILFYFVGFLMGKLWVYSKVSTYYLVLYIYCLLNIVAMVSHGITRFFSPIFFFGVFIYPFMRTILIFTNRLDNNEINNKSCTPNSI